MTNLKVMVMVVATACGSMFDPAAHRQLVAQVLDHALTVNRQVAVSDGVTLPEAPQPKKLQSDQLWGD